MNDSLNDELKTKLSEETNLTIEQISEIDELIRRYADAETANSCLFSIEKDLGKEMFEIIKKINNIIKRNN